MVNRQSQSQVRCMGRMQSLMLIGRLHLSGIWLGFVFKNGHQKDTCYNEIGLCAKNIDTVLGSHVDKVGIEGPL